MTNLRTLTGDVPRIVFVELSKTGLGHVPFNAMLWRTATFAFPDAATDIWAEATHLDALAEFLPDLAARATLRPIALVASAPGKEEELSWRRVAAHMRLVLAVCRAYPRERIVLVVSSLCATGLGGARLAARRLGAGRVRMLAVLHGNIATLEGGWRPRNPLIRALDLGSVLRRGSPPGFRYLVLEDNIRDRLATLVPRLRDRLDLLPHPVVERECAAAPARVAGSPPSAGFLGAATRAKGFETFVQIAADLAACGQRIGLRHVGWLHPHLAGLLPRADAVLDGGAGRGLPRAAFMAAVQSLDYVCLPYGGAYYGLAASGSLMDAVACCRPVVAMRSPLTDAFFARHGDIGFLCEDAADLREALAAIASRPDPARYAAQVAAMQRLQQSRLPAALAADFRAAVDRLAAPAAQHAA